MSEHLPHILNSIADAVAPVVGGRSAGVTIALMLARLKGGQRIYLPAKVDHDHWLSREVGLDAAVAICNHFSVGGVGQHIDMPFGPGSGQYAIQRRARARAYTEAQERGLNANQAAAEIGVSRRSVYSARARMRPDGPDLFSDGTKRG